MKGPDQELPPTIEAPKKKESKTRAPKKDKTGPKDLDAMLRELDNAATQASMSEKEIDEMVKQRQESLDELADLNVIESSRLSKVENYNPLKGLEPGDYDRLFQEGIISKDEMDQGKMMDVIISKYESINNLTEADKVNLLKTADLRSQFQKKIEIKIANAQEEMQARQNEVMVKVIEHYAKKAEVLEKTIADIEANPRLINVLYKTAEEEMKAFETKIEEQRKNIVEDAARCIQSLGTRHANAFKRIGELLGNEKISDELIGSLENTKHPNIFDEVRSRLIAAIIDNEGADQLKDPKEVVPWEVKTTSVNYRTAIEFLRSQMTEKMLKESADAGNEKAKKLLGSIKPILEGNEVIRRLVGSKKFDSPFWKAFETRSEFDKKGITKKRKEERERIAKQEADLKKKIQELIDKGGIKVNEVPVYGNVRGQRILTGHESGVVLIERCKTGKGNDYWKVTDTCGITDVSLVGKTSTLDMRSFPQWLAKAAKNRGNF